MKLTVRFALLGMVVSLSALQAAEPRPMTAMIPFPPVVVSCWRNVGYAEVGGSINRPLRTALAPVSLVIVITMFPLICQLK
jgi:hypothetical protein